MSKHSPTKPIKDMKKEITEEVSKDIHMDVKTEIEEEASKIMSQGVKEEIPTKAAVMRYTCMDASGI